MQKPLVDLDDPRILRGTVERDQVQATILGNDGFRVPRLLSKALAPIRRSSKGMVTPVAEDSAPICQYLGGALSDGVDWHSRLQIIEESPAAFAPLRSVSAVDAVRQFGNSDRTESGFHLTQSSE